MFRRAPSAFSLGARARRHAQVRTLATDAGRVQKPPRPKAATPASAPASAPLATTSMSAATGKGAQTGKGGAGDKAGGSGEADDAYPKDFRPQWMFTGVRWGQWIGIPVFAIYGIFFMDFGENEHAFMPARRWLARKRAAFFTLSPEEQALVEDMQKPRPMASAARPWQSTPPTPAELEPRS